MLAHYQRCAVLPLIALRPENRLRSRDCRTRRKDKNCGQKESKTIDLLGHGLFLLCWLINVLEMLVFAGVRRMERGCSREGTAAAP